MMTTTTPLLQDWELSQLGAGRSAITTGERLRVLTRFASDTNLDPLTCDPRDISRWFARNRTHWSPSTLATYHSYFCAFYKWAQRQHLRTDNPMLMLDPPRTPERTPRPVSDAGLMHLLCTPMRDKTRRMILLATLEGFRVSEVASTRGEDYDLPGGTVRVTGKGSKTATIPLHPIIADMAASMPRKGFWFPSPVLAGEHILAKSVSQIVGNAMRRAGVSGTPHSLRHWFASNLLASGADLLTIRELLRHSSVATTQIYTKVPDGRRSEAVSRLDPYRGRSHNLHQT